MRIQCPNCRAVLRVDEALAGKNGICPKCKQVLQIPVPALKSPPPIAKSAPPSVAQLADFGPEHGFSSAITTESLSRDAHATPSLEIHFHMCLGTVLF
jgi:predicted Zn finger-like uncharacterized protein